MATVGLPTYNPPQQNAPATSPFYGGGSQAGPFGYGPVATGQMQQMGAGGFNPFAGTPFGGGGVMTGMPGAAPGVRGGLGGMSAMHPGSASISNQQLMQLAMNDYFNTQQAQAINYDRMQGVEGQLRGLIGDIGMQADAYNQKITALGEQGAGRLEEMGAQHYGDFTDFRDQSLATMENQFQAAIERAETAFSTFDKDSMAALAAQATAIDENLDQRAMQINSNPDLTPAQRSQAMTSLNFQRSRMKQMEISPRVQQQELMSAQLGMQVAQLQASLSSTGAGVRTQFGAQTLDAQRQQAQMQNLAEGMRQSTANMGRISQLQAEQMQLQGHGMLAQMIQNNPFRHTSQLSVGMLANYLQTVQPQFNAGFNPQGLGAKSFRDVDDYPFLSLSQYQGPRGFVNPRTGNYSWGQQMWNNKASTTPISMRQGSQF